MSHQPFGTEHISQLYAKYRPKPPQELINAILDFLGQKLKPNESGRWNCAVDVGCGPGECTQMLHPYFDEVHGFDVSQTQVEEANKRKPENVFYEVSPAESLPLPNDRVSLLTASQSAHWFNLDEFFKEADRVLMENGVLAIFAYLLPTLHAIDGSVKEESTLENLMFKTFTHLNLTQYWHEEEDKIVDTRYENIVPPYKDFVRLNHLIAELNISCEDLCGHIESWSGFNKCKEDDPEKAKKVLEHFVQVFKEQTSGDLTTKVTVRFRYSLILTRKTVSSPV